MAKRFSRVYIEITNVCNLSCSFCIKTTRAPRFMSEGEFEQILRKISRYTDHIYLHILGEPLLHPQLRQLLQLAYVRKISVNITTNGTLLGSRQEVLLCSPAVRKISISLHSMEEGSPHFGREYLQSVSAFSRLAAASGIYCDLRLWNIGAQGTKNERVIAQLCSELGLDDVVVQSAKEKMRKGGNVTLAPKIFLGAAERFEWPSMGKEPIGDKVFCYGMRNQIGVLCDGTVVPCCLDSCGDINLGNIFQTELEDILSSERAKSLYDGFSNRCASEELCRRCGYATRF